MHTHVLEQGPYMLPHTCCPAASPMHMHVTCTSIHPCTRHLHLRVYPWCLKCRRTFVHAGRALAQATLLGPAPPACTFVYPCRVLCGVKCGSTIGVKFLSSVCVRLGVLPTDTVSSVCVRLGVPPTRQRSGWQDATLLQHVGSVLQQHGARSTNAMRWNQELQLQQDAGPSTAEFAPSSL